MNRCSRSSARSITSHDAPRSGVAAVEFAVCLPAMMLLLVGTVETANAIFLKQSLTIVAYETAQIASSSGGTESAALTRAGELFTNFGVRDGTVAISPNVNANVKPKTIISVTVTAPVTSNSIGFSEWFAGRTAQSTVVMFRL